MKDTENLRAIAAYLAGYGNREDADFIISIVDRIKELEAELSRYRWLRDQCGSGGLTVAQVREHGLDAWSGDDLDTAINRAAAPEVGE